MDRGIGVVQRLGLSSVLKGTIGNQDFITYDSRLVYGTNFSYGMS